MRRNRPHQLSAPTMSAELLQYRCSYPTLKNGNRSTDNALRLEDRRLLFVPGGSANRLDIGLDQLVSLLSLIDMYILGISGHQRDAAAALLKDGQIVAAIEEEKLARILRIGISQSGGLPYQAISYCLEAAGIGIEDLHYVTYDHKPHWLLKREFEFNQRFLPENASEAIDQKATSLYEFYNRMKTLRLIRQLLNCQAKIIAVDHHLAHAASAFYPAGFDRAAVLILGRKGDHISIAAGVGEGRKLRILKRIEFPHSLGWVYSLITEHLGFRANGGERNLQWLRNYLKKKSSNKILSLRKRGRRIGQPAVPEQSASELKLSQVVFALPLVAHQQAPAFG